MLYVYYSKKQNKQYSWSRDLLVVEAPRKKAAEAEIKSRGLIVAEWQLVSKHSAGEILTSTGEYD